MKITINDLMINSMANLKKISLVKSASTVAIVGTLLLSGCGPAKDVTAPVISTAYLTENVITVEATDNKAINGYIITYINNKPAANAAGWQTTNTFNVTEDGTYYVWVKDAAGNITGYSESIVVNTLAERFDHLNWLTPATGTKTVDGVTYNLADLKATYGDLYRYVEPLTNAEVEARFAYIAEFYEVQLQKSIEMGGLGWQECGIDYSDMKLQQNIDDLKQIANKKMATTTDSKLLPLKGNFYKSNWTGFYEMYSPDSFTSKIGAWGIGTDIINIVPFADKNLYVRYFMVKYEIILQAHKDLGIEPDYIIEDWKSFTK